MYKEDLSYGLFLSDRQLDFLSKYSQGFDRMKCFATFLQMAVIGLTQYEKKGYSVDLTPGQFAISEVELAKLWKCNRKTASKIVDMFHEMGLVSSVPNYRTTVFTVHCIASWYIGNQVIRNTHYSRHPQVKQRVKGHHKSQAKKSLSLRSKDIERGKTIYHSDGQTIEQRDEYTYKRFDKVIRDNPTESNGSIKELFIDGVEPTPLNVGILSPSNILSDINHIDGSSKNEVVLYSVQPRKNHTDAATTSHIETMTEKAD